MEEYFKLLDEYIDLRIKFCDLDLTTWENRAKKLEMNTLRDKLYVAFYTLLNRRDDI